MRDDISPLASELKNNLRVRSSSKVQDHHVIQDSHCNYGSHPNQQTNSMDYLDRDVRSIIKGRYGIRFVKDIGSGYAGTVYKCLKESSDRSSDHTWLAVKVMNKSKIKARAAEIEATLLKRGRGPFILEFLAAAECLDAYLLVTEFCGRGDLHGMLPHMDNCNIMARDYLRGVALGLSRLHDMFIAHCDIKMRNIVIDDNNVPKIADFGFATQLSHRRERITTCVGTKDYWAPEMWQKRPYFNPFRADVYALGVTFLGVCEKRPIKRKDNDIHDIVDNLPDVHMKVLFKGFLDENHRERITLDLVLNNPWMTGYLTPPSSPLPSPPASP